MSKTEAIVSTLSDDDLTDAIRGLKIFDENLNAPAEGTFRRVVETVTSELETSGENAVGFSRLALLREAAYRWAGAKAAGPKSKRTSKEQARQRFLSLVRGAAETWAGYELSDELKRCNGVASSLLAVIDGSTGEFPALDLVVRPQPDERARCIQEGENYYVYGLAINDDCALRELFQNRPDDVAVPETGKSRAYTKVEVRNQVLAVMQSYAQYWATLPGITAEERCHGMGFSLLNIFDGTAAGLPPFDLRTRPRADARSYDIAKGRDYFNSGLILNANGDLHGEYYER
jgi:hypothetical protein